MTMTFANVQQIIIRQGPLQRLLGIADLQVRTAGGGGGSSEKEGAGHQTTESMHVGYFRGVNNAGEIRDLILERLRQFRDAGLGDPDDLPDTRISGGTDWSGVLAAVSDLRQEVQALRTAIS